MAGTLTERLQLVVEATTQSAEARFDKLTATARETGDASVRSAADVATAADRVMAAQAKQADAAGQVLVAERKLNELREGGRASASQLEAAEQKLESQKRKLHIASRDVARATEQEEVATRQATDATRDADRAQRDYGTGLGDLKGKLGGLLAGGALVAGFHSVTQAAEESARIAGRTENVIRTTGQAAGLTADQVGDLSGAIAAKTGVDDEAIQSGANLLLTFTNVKDAVGDGNDIFTQATSIMTDMSAALGTDASASAVQLGKALNDPIRGVSALSKVGVSFTAEQREQIRTLTESGNVMGAQKIILGELSREFGGAAEAMSTPMDRARVTLGNLAETIGGSLLPLVDAAAGALQGTADVAGTIPLPFGLAATAAVLLGVAKRSAADDSGYLSRALDGVKGSAGTFRTAMENAATGPGIAARSMGAARVAGSGLMGLMGGPLGLAVVGLGAGFTLLNKFTGENKEQAEASAGANKDLAAALAESGGVVTRTVREQAAASAQQAGILATTKAAGVAQGDVTAALLGNEDAYERVKVALDAYSQAALDRVAGNTEDASFVATMEAAEGAKDELEQLRSTTDENATSQTELSQELAETTDKAALATAATDALKEALEAGNVPTAELARLAGEAARAQDEAASADGRAEAALEAYRATTSKAVDATLELISARYGAENANFAFLQAMDAARTATDDGSTSVNENRQAYVQLMEAALAAAKAAADAAVENAEATGQVVDDVAEAQIRADAMLTDLRGKLDTPGLTAKAREEMQGLIDQLQGAKDRGDIQAVLTLTGAPEAGRELDETTADREATVTVESRNGPAVDAYLDSLAAAARLAIIRVESRGGPDVDRYLDELRVRDRLAIVRVESRGGPAVDNYLGGLAQERLSIIRVETRGGPDVDRYLDDLASNWGRGRTAVIDVQRPAGAPAPGRPAGAPALGTAGLFGAGGNVTVQQLAVTVQADSAGRVTAQSAADGGRQVVQQLGAYTRQNGPSWLRGIMRDLP